MSDANVPDSGGSDVKIPILIGSVVALLGANIYLFTQLNNLRTDFGEFRKATLGEISSLKESSSVSTQTARRSLTSLKDELETARRQAQMAAGQARIEAQKHAEELAKRLQLEQARQEQASAKKKTDLTEAVSNVEKTATNKISEVSTEVSNVKSEVQTAKSELDRTVQDLKRVRGDLDGTSSLVATNGKELTALRALGERNYFEFNISKSKEPRRVGDVAVLLK